jgi:ATP-dependent RNA helicase RhlE
LQFESFDLHPSIFANVKALGYETPTPIQKDAIPHVLDGRDVMGLAQTGTGKTAAFLLPIIDRFLKNPSTRKGSARALVIAPTRELAEQIHESARDYAKGLRFRSVTVYGGVGLGPQAQNLRRGADLVVACPGRLLDHCNQGHADLSGVEVLVLDEADHMFDMGFLPDIKKILSKLPAERQTLLFSATMPDSIRGLAGETLKDPVTVKVGRSAPAQTIEQALYPVRQHLKTKLLVKLLDETATDGSVLVFTRTKHRAKRLAEQLGRLNHPSACLQGNLSQAQRQKAMDGFRDGRFRVLVATDIAARGIDVSRVAHVVNYDLPDTPETYTHRVGRTGRAEREGQAYSFVGSEDVSMVRAIERLLGKTIERRKVEGFDYLAAAPDRDTEFARPPLPGRRNASGSGSGARAPAGRVSAGRGYARRDDQPVQDHAWNADATGGQERFAKEERRGRPGQGRPARSGQDGGQRSAEAGYGRARSAGQRGEAGHGHAFSGGYSERQPYGHGHGQSFSGGYSDHQAHAGNTNVRQAKRHGDDIAEEPSFNTASAPGGYYAVTRDSSGAPMYDSYDAGQRRQPGHRKTGGELQPSGGGYRQGERRAQGTGTSGERKASSQKNAGFYGRVAEGGERKSAAPKGKYRQGGEGRPKRRQGGGEAA